MIRLEMTSSPFHGPEGEANLAACRRAAEEAGFEFGVQVHNTETVGVLERFHRLGYRVSVHAPLVGEYLLNLAGEDFTAVREAFAEHASLFRRFGVAEAVFHGFLMTDVPVPAFGRGRSYDECLRRAFRPELSYDGSLRFNADFTGSEEFALRRERVKERLAWLSAACPEIAWHIENDFPAYGSAAMFARDLAYLEHDICLDTGHLWATVNLFELDWREEVEAFFATGRVGMVHLHASVYTGETPKAELGDGHKPLRIPNRMGLKGLVQAGRRAGVRHWVLEIVAGTPDDIAAFAALWRGEGIDE